MLPLVGLAAFATFLHLDATSHNDSRRQERMSGDGRQSASSIMANAASSMQQGNAAEAASLYREAAAAAREEGSGVSLTHPCTLFPFLHKQQQRRRRHRHRHR